MSADELPGGLHEPTDGRVALDKVRDALGRLRPDLAATVLASALGEVSTQIPRDRRWQFRDACLAMVSNSLLRKVNEA